MPEKELISSVVMAYDEQANIAWTIQAITALDDLGEHEIIVDDDSHDRAVSIVKEIAATSETVRLIELGTNYGRGFARDGGIAQARGEYIATIDIILPPDWLVQTRAAIEEHSAVDGTPVPDGDVAYIYRMFRLNPQFVGNITKATGNNGLYRRKVFELVRFDMTSRQDEDVALNYAMRQAL